MSDTDKKVDLNQEPEEKLWAYMAEFDSADDVIHAAEKVRDAGFTKWDVHTPFPVHGLDKAMGVRPTILPWLVLAGGLTGMTTAIVLQWYTNMVEGPWDFSGYAFKISGKPNSLVGLPAMVPVIFELTVLFSALTAVFGSLALNGLPRHYFAAWRNRRFDRATSDRFCVVIEADDPQAGKAKALLAGLGGRGEVEELHDTTKSDALPKGIKWAIISMVLLSWIPFAMILRKRYTPSESPPIHVVPNMDWQQKFKPQSPSTIFDDGRAMRLPVAGAVARGSLDHVDANGHDAFSSGKNADGSFLQMMPIDATDKLMARGQRQYNIYCIACHGQLGEGDGLVSQRAFALQEANWIQPSKLSTDPLIHAREDGYIFDAITNGIRTMKGYGAQLSAEDRWAIVLWVRALQSSRLRDIDTLPKDIQAKLRGN
ncbi:MAG: DUF3341 domain-containing protein [Planctomycetes bacterium]|nr:DUF3341 domain-containing protein [Planctomycetota bacterium]MCB9917522.1 DUF3341 domain-containing protein [Planctomycetota bacterium]